MNHRLVLATVALSLLAVPRTGHTQPPAAPAATVPATNKANARKWLTLGLEQDKNGDATEKMSRLLDAAQVLHQIGDQADAIMRMKAAEALVPPPGPGFGRNIVRIVSTYFAIGEWDKALAFAAANGADNAQTYAAVGEARAKAKDAGAKATLLTAQTKAVEIGELIERSDLLQQVAEGFLTLGATKDAAAALKLSSAALDKETNIQRGIPKFERQVKQARLLHQTGETDAAQALLAKVEKDTLASPYVYSEQGLVLYRAAAAYREMGKPEKADALALKAAPLIVKIESEGNEPYMLRQSLKQQALAGQVTSAIARAKKGEFGLSPERVLLEIAEALGKMKRTADAKNVLAEVATLNAAISNVGQRLLAELELAPAMADAGDKAGADNLFNSVAQRIDFVPEERNRPAFWALWVEKRAASDLPAATAHIDDTLPELRGEVYLALARAAGAQAALKK